MLYAGLMALIYPLGTPLLYAGMLYANREAIEKTGKLERALITSCSDKSKKTEDRLSKEEDKLKRKELGALREETDQLRKEVEGKIRNDHLGTGGLAKLTAPYEMRAYWFEVFECVRKICLVGLPIFVEHGSAAQLIMGLLVCFISFGMYASYEPYVEASDDLVAKVCQVSLFFSLVSSIALKMEPDNSLETLGVLLLFTVAVPMVIALFFLADIDFVQILQVSKIKRSIRTVFERTLGRWIDRCLQHYTMPGGPPSRFSIRHSVLQKVFPERAVVESERSNHSATEEAVEVEVDITGLAGDGDIEGTFPRCAGLGTPGVGADTGAGTHVASYSAQALPLSALREDRHAGAGMGAGASVSPRSLGALSSPSGGALGVETREAHATLETSQPLHAFEAPSNASWDDSETAESTSLGRVSLSLTRHGKHRAAVERPMNRASPNLRANRASMIAADEYFGDASGSKASPGYCTSARSSEGLRRFLDAAQCDSSTTANHHEGSTAGARTAAPTIEQRINRLETAANTDIDGDGDVGEDGHFNRDLEA